LDDQAGWTLVTPAAESGFVQVTGQAQRNVNDGVSYLQVADGALDEVTTLLTRASQLAQQARTGTISASNRANLDAEFQNILKTVINIGQNTQFNGQSVFSSVGAPQTLQVRAGDYGTLSSGIGALSSSSTSALGLGAGATITTTTTSLGTPLSAAGSAAVARANAECGGSNLQWGNFAARGLTHGLSLNNSADVNANQAYADAWQATRDWKLIGADASTQAALLVSAKGYVDIFVLANPSDLSGLATQAGLAYAIANPAPQDPADPSSNNTAVIAAAAAATYTPTITTTTTTTSGGTDLLTTGAAASAATLLSAALASVSTMRASIGANEAQLNATSDILGIQVQNFTAAQSQIEDANVADEVVSLTKFQILNQSGTNALSKANQASQQILALLQ
jgi:flagellin